MDDLILDEMGTDGWSQGGPGGSWDDQGDQDAGLDVDLGAGQDVLAPCAGQGGPDAGLGETGSVQGESDLDATAQDDSDQGALVLDGPE